jgi:hypothetical protein
MGRSAYDISIRETLQRRGIGTTLAAVLFCAAIAIAGYYFRPFGHKPNYSEIFYSDDDGKTYFKDSIYKLAPFDHNGRTANEAIVIQDHGAKVVGYLVRYIPEAQKKLTDRYNDDVNNRLSDTEIQQDVLTYMHEPDIYLHGQECKLPGPDNNWMPRYSFSTTMIKTPSGDLPEGAVLP